MTEYYGEFEELKGTQIWKDGTFYEEWTSEEYFAGFRIASIRDKYMEVHVGQQPELTVLKDSKGNRAYTVIIRLDQDLPKKCLSKSKTKQYKPSKIPLRVAQMAHTNRVVMEPVLKEKIRVETEMEAIGKRNEGDLGGVKDGGLGFGEGRILKSISQERKRENKLFKKKNKSFSKSKIIMPFFDQLADEKTWSNYNLKIVDEEVLGLDGNETIPVQGNGSICHQSSTTTSVRTVFKMNDKKSVIPLEAEEVKESVREDSSWERRSLIDLEGEEGLCKHSNSRVTFSSKIKKHGSKKIRDGHHSFLNDKLKRSHHDSNYKARTGKRKGERTWAYRFERSELSFETQEDENGQVNIEKTNQKHGDIIERNLCKEFWKFVVSKIMGEKVHNCKIRRRQRICPRCYGSITQCFQDGPDVLKRSGEQKR